MSKKMPVVIRGVEYPSIKDAAMRLGVSRQTVWCALERGTQDRIGLGQGKHPGFRGGRCKPITIGPRTFISRSAASRFMGKDPGYVKEMLKRGRHDLILASLMKAIAKEEKDAREKQARVRASSVCEGDEEGIPIREPIPRSNPHAQDRSNRHAVELGSRKAAGGKSR